MIDGKDLYHITSCTDLHAFKDIEDIYAYKETFLPFRVSRLIKRSGGFSTRIEEEYDQDTFRIKIRKMRKFFPRKTTIERDCPIYNAILLPYYYRTKPLIKKGNRFKITLPTTDFDIVLKGKETVSTRLGKYPAHVFTSIPSNFTFWLSTDKKRIPLKIESDNMLGYSFVINSIKDTAQ